MSESGAISWFAVDWGTTHLRVWALDAAGSILWQRDSDDGMGRLDPGAAFEAAFLRLVGADMPATRIPVIVAGMAGSRQGWVEAPYTTAPCTVPGIDTATRAPANDARLAVYVLPGIKQLSPPDVMRGEETQIAGLLARMPGFDGVVCLPGTHTKWVHISAREVVSFQTFMTGELFALLGERSVLRHSVASGGMDEAAFLDAVGSALARPAGLAASLFTIRSAGLVASLPPVVARARLSGVLIGAELAAARPYWLGQRVVIIGADGIADAYRIALAAQGVEAERVAADALTLDGLRAAYAALTEDA